MKKVVITADSAADLPLSLAKSIGVDIIPLSIVIEDKSFFDGVNITPEDIFSYCSGDGVMPKTAAVTPAAYADFFKKHTDNGCEVVHLSLSSGISSTYQNACIAASEQEGVYVVDSLSLHTGIALLVLRAHDLAEEGKIAAEIARILEQERYNICTTFIISQLDYLVKGGRCSALAALGANLLSIRPSIDMTGGELKVGKKYRGKMEACFRQYVRDCLGDADNIDLRRVFISHSGIPRDLADNIEALVRETLPFQEVYTSLAGCTIASHCGPNTLAVIYMKKPL